MFRIDDAELMGFVGVLMHAAHSIEHQRIHRMEKAGKLVEECAKDAIGTYHFGWPPLAPETVARKATGDSPLLETGELRDSIEHKVVDAHTVDVGTNDPKAPYHELGTAKIPARSFLVSAAMEQEHAVVELFGEGARTLLHKP